MKPEKKYWMSHRRHSRKFPDNSETFRFITAENAPFHFVEAYNALRTNIEFLSATSGAKCFVITSALPDEGKSNVTLNLAASLSQNGNRVIVVECDLRKPSMHRLINVSRSLVGLSSVLSGTSILKDSLIQCDEGKFSILPAGIAPSNPSEILGKPQMSALLNFLKKHFDYILLDAPPVFLVTDAAVLGRIADGALLVIRSNYAQTAEIIAAKEKLEAVNVKVFGTIVTRYDIKKQVNRRGYSSYHYRYTSYSE